MWPRRIQGESELTSKRMPVALTIAGSDSGGGAGIQADLKTFNAFDVFGTTAVTCLTAQNPDEVTAVTAIEPDMVAQQVRTICSAFPVAAAKTGMLYSAEIIRAVCDVIRECGIRKLVVDPVMVATSGARLLRDDAVESMRTTLLPLARVVTPNTDEAEILCGFAVNDDETLRRAARVIGKRYGTACVAKGGHLDPSSPEVVDCLYDDGDVLEFRTARVAAGETHGTGCTFSAALAACLARGKPLAESMHNAQAFVAKALADARPVGRHAPLYPRPLPGGFIDRG